MHHSKAEKENESSVLFITSHVFSNYFPSNKLLKANTAGSSKRIQTFQKTVTLVKAWNMTKPWMKIEEF